MTAVNVASFIDISGECHEARFTDTSGYCRLTHCDSFIDISGECHQKQDDPDLHCFQKRV